MIIHEITDLSNTEVVRILKQGLSEITDETFKKNYHPDYNEVPGNIFRILYEKRYSTGKFYVIEEDNKFMACSGYYKYTDEIALILTRTYTSPMARHNHYLGKYLIPLMIEETKHYEKVWATVNEYNKQWYEWVMKSKSKSKSSLINGPDYMKSWAKFKPIGKQVVNYVEQYVLELDKSL